MFTKRLFILSVVSCVLFSGHVCASEVKTGEKITPTEKKLLLMAKNGTFAELQNIIDTGVNINARNELGQTALMFAAASKNNAANVEKLIKVGADLNAKDAQDMTALMYASRKGNIQNIRILLDAGAERSIKNKFGETFDMILKKNYPELSAEVLQPVSDRLEIEEDEDQPGMPKRKSADSEEKKRYSISSSTTPPGGMVIEHDE